MESFSTEGVACKIFPCIVCSLQTNSIDELHNHQKYCHTTEELSLSVICLVHYMCLKNEVSGSNFTSNNNYPLLLQSHAANYHFYQLQNQRNTNTNNDCAMHNPTLYNSETNNQTQSLVEKTRMAKIHEQENQAPHYSPNCARCLRACDNSPANAKTIGTDINATFTSSWELELDKAPEISDETFLKSVYGICEDLKIIKKPAIKSKQGFLKSASQIKPAKKRTGKQISLKISSQKSFVLPLRQRNTKGLQRSQTCAKSPVVHRSKEKVSDMHQEINPIDYSFTNNYGKCEDRVKLTSFSQSFHFLAQKNKATCTHVMGTANRNKDPQRLDQVFLDEGIPVLEEALKDLNCQQEPRKMPVLKSYLHIDELPQSDIQEKTKDDNESDDVLADKAQRITVNFCDTA